MERRKDLMSTVLLVILILLLVGAFPGWPHSANWGYGPSGGIGLLLIILLILVITSRRSPRPIRLVVIRTLWRSGDFLVDHPCAAFFWRKLDNHTASITQDHFLCASIATRHEEGDT